MDNSQIATIPKADQRTEWLRKRRESLGASEAAVVMGVSKWKSPYALWSEKTGLVESITPPTEPQEWGLRLEDVIAKKYEETTGQVLTNLGAYAIQKSKTHPFMSCTLDRRIEPIDDRGPGALEIKAVGAHRADDWQEEPPLDYQIQVQHQLFVTGYRWGAIAALIGGQKFKWAKVERNEKFIELLVEKCTEFWHLVETNTPPAIDGTDSTLKALRAIYPIDTGESVLLSPEALDWDAEIQEADKQIKEAELKRKEALNRILAEIGSATYGVLRANAGRWSYKTQTRKAHEIKESTVRVARRLAK